MATRVRLRAKLFALLAGVVFLPLLGAILSIVLGANGTRLDLVRKTFQTVAESAARVLELSVAEDLQRLQTVLAAPEVVDALSAIRTPLPAAEIRARDEAWGKLPEDRGPLAEVLSGPGADALRELRRESTRIVEVFITDRFGQLVSATNRTTDFFQADETWWNEASRTELGLVVMPPVGWEESAGVWSLDLCVPVVRGGEVIGVAKAVIDISRWIGGLERSVERMRASLMLVNSKGSIIYRPGVKPLEGFAPEWSDEIASTEVTGFRVTADGEVQAYAAVRLVVDRSPEASVAGGFLLFLCADRGEVLGPLRVLLLKLLGVGLLLALATLAAGAFVLHRGLLRRIRSVGEATRRAAAGDLKSRVPVDGSEPGRDEIHDLEEDFNRFVAEVERRELRMEASDTLRRRFVRTAAQELRAPVRYISSTAKVLSDCRDPDRLAEAVSMMGAKAEQLESIAHAMFRLMPDGALPRRMNYSDFDARTVVEHALKEASPFLERRRQTLSSDLPPDPVVVRADRDKLLAILENCVSAAIACTPEGGAVGVRLCEETGTVRVEVSDQGPEIPKEDVARILEVGRTLHDSHSSTADQESTGIDSATLRLGIVRYFLELHRGTMELRSGPKGNTLDLSFPRTPPAD